MNFFSYLDINILNIVKIHKLNFQELYELYIVLLRKSIAGR